MKEHLLYEWESYSYRNYPLYSPPRVQHRSVILRLLQWVWARIARFVDRYRSVHLYARDCGIEYEYVLYLCDRGSGPWKTMNANEMLDFAKLLSEKSNRNALQIAWGDGTVQEILDIPRWAVPHVRHALMLAVFHHLIEGQAKARKVEENLKTRGFS